MSDVLTTGGLDIGSFLSTRQAAESLGVPRSKVLSLIYRQRIESRRIGRFYFIHRSEVERARAIVAVARLAA